jgi:putative phosphoribosyl transferase
MDVIDDVVRIESGHAVLDADLRVPQRAAGLVIFAHGSGSGRFSPRNRAVAGVLEAGGFATLLCDLLTKKEESEDQYTRQHRFDIPLLGRRVVDAVDWAQAQPELRTLPVATFGASTGAAAALIAAAERPKLVRAVISRGGRPDLADDALERVQAPTLLIVGGNDDVVIGLNQEAARRMRAPVELEIVPGATHLFEEPGTLEKVAALATNWCTKHLKRQP